MIRVNNKIIIDEKDIREEFFTSGGPGGQNVNKLATAVRLRFDVLKSKGLAPDVKERLLRLAGGAATSEGVVVVVSRRFRTQERNREDAFFKLKVLILSAVTPPKKRVKTGATRASREKRLSSKRIRSFAKNKRRKVDGAD